MKKAILFYMLAILSISMKAQVTPVDTNTNKIIIIKQDESVPADRAANKYQSGYRNMIRWNMFELGRGIISFGYERSLNDWFSLDFVLGYTLKDYLGSSLDDMEDENDYSTGAYTGTDVSSINGGIAFMIGGRLYPGQSGDMEGFYVAPHFYSKNYNATKTVNVELRDSLSQNYTYNKSFPMSRTENDLGIRFGLQGESNLDNLFWDYYIGLTSRSRTYDYLEEVKTYFSTTGNEQITGYKTVSKSKNVMGFLLGFNLGYAF